ncbi:MAG: putative formyltransferase [Clostridiales bacterium]|jgi:methionyl-tRNA formyltransferase|nr:putative formyltransferase [Clostridiales bacterium]
MHVKKKLIITDNDFLYNEFLRILRVKNYSLDQFDFRYSHNNNILKEKYSNNYFFLPINLNKETKEVLEKYNLIISLHCKQIFPKKIVKNLRCLNIHPGFNPYNRGYYPQVFSIINKLPVGVTIHEIDEYIDHGNIIYQEKVSINEWETSKDVYEKILKLEIEMLEKYLDKLLLGDYISTPMIKEGNINYLRDFHELCKLDLNENLTMRQAIDKLRALTFGDYKNAFFIDEEGNKIYVKISLELEKEN